MYRVTYWKGDVYHIQQVELGIFSSKNGMPSHLFLRVL